MNPQIEREVREGMEITAKTLSHAAADSTVGVERALDHVEQMIALLRRHIEESKRAEETAGAA